MATAKKVQAGVELTLESAWTAKTHVTEGGKFGPRVKFESVDPTTGVSVIAYVPTAIAGAKLEIALLGSAPAPAKGATGAKKAKSDAELFAEFMAFKASQA